MKNRPRRFELHQARVRKRKLEPDQVSLSKTNIVISEELGEQLKGVTQVVFLYDPDEHVIGIREARGNERGFKISFRSISARSFYLHFGITERGRFRARFEGKVLQIALNETRHELL